MPSFKATASDRVEIKNLLISDMYGSVLYENFQNLLLHLYNKDYSSFGPDEFNESNEVDYMAVTMKRNFSPKLMKKVEAYLRIRLSED